MNGWSRGGRGRGLIAAFATVAVLASAGAGYALAQEEGGSQETETPGVYAAEETEGTVYSLSPISADAAASLIDRVEAGAGSPISEAEVDACSEDGSPDPACDALLQAEADGELP